MVDELYLQYLGVLPSSNDEPEEPEEDPDSSYVSSYVSVYVKPDPKPPASKPSNTGGISLPPPPVRPPASKPSNTGGISLPPPPRYDPRPDSQKPGGKPAKKTIIPLPRPNVDIPLVAYTSGDIHKARDIENRYQDLIQDHLLPDDIDYQEAQAAFERADVQRLSDEQQLRIDYLLGTEDDPLTRSMLLAIKHEGIPGHLTFDEYMTRFADWGLVEESDRRAWQVMQSNIKDVTNDNWESARAIDLNSGEEVFLRAGSKDSVLLQDEQKRMLEGRDIALIHNHPNNSPASNADLSAAIDLGVMFLVLVTPAGLQYHYRRYGDEMKLVEVIHNSDYVALSSAEEDEESRAAYEAQLLAEAGNPAEWVMRQGEADSWFEFEFEDGFSIKLNVPEGLSVEGAQTLATQLWESEQNDYSSNRLRFTEDWMDLWQDDSAKQRERAYRLISDALDSSEGIRGDIRFYRAAQNVSFLFSLGEEYIIHQAVNSLGLFFKSYPTDVIGSAMRLLDKIGDDLMEFNREIIFEHFEAAFEGDHVLISPLADVASASILVETGLEWDIHMVWREQLELEEILADYREPGDDISGELAVISELITMQHIAPVFRGIADVFDSTASDAVKWVSGALGGPENLDFQELEHRRAIGIAMAFQAHDKTEEEFEAYFREMLASESKELPPEIQVFD